MSAFVFLNEIPHKGASIANIPILLNILFILPLGKKSLFVVRHKVHKKA